jgi:holo-[acyl-carrier protein] synthase
VPPAITWIQIAWVWLSLVQKSMEVGMNLTTGVDLIEIERVEQAASRHGERFLSRVFTPAELAECGLRYDSLAARFAAKEAVAKALGSGIGRVGWQEIEILRGSENQPVLYLHGMAGELAETWSISLSHTRFHAIAMVVAIAP